jgi:hypothetical protein
MRSIEQELIREDGIAVRVWWQRHWHYFHRDFKPDTTSPGPEAYALDQYQVGPERSLRWFIAHHRYAAAERGVPHSLTDEQIADIITRDCYFCGAPAIERVLDRGPRRIYVLRCHTIDRLDSWGGYTVDNCVSCCIHCNRIKFEYSVDEFREHIDRIYRHFVSVA